MNTRFNLSQPDTRTIKVAFLITNPRFRGLGLGSEILRILNEAWNIELHTWETRQNGNKTIRNRLFDWYLKLGFTVTDTDNFSYTTPAGQDIVFRTFRQNTPNRRHAKDNDDDALDTGTVVHESDDEEAAPAAASSSSNSSSSSSSKR